MNNGTSARSIPLPLEWAALAPHLIAGRHSEVEH
jgi:hypothetical protein